MKPYLFQVVRIANGQIFERWLANKFNLFGENLYAARVSGYLAGRAAESWAVFLNS